MPLWEEYWTGANSVMVTDGLFNVLLGSLSPGLSTVVQGRDELYLGITVGTDSEMTPRSQLGSTPFAMQALTVSDGAISNTKIALTYWEASPPSDVAVNAICDDSEEVLSLEVDSPLDGNYLVLVKVVSSHSLGGRYLFLHLRDKNEQILGRFSNMVNTHAIAGGDGRQTAAALGFWSASAGLHSIRLMACTNEGGGIVKTGTRVLAIPFAKP